MSVVHPWILLATAASIAGVIVAHLLSVRRPPEMVLPTAAFLDERTVRAVARSSRPSDLWLLALRIGALLLAGLALAGISWASQRASIVSAVLLDARVSGDSLAWRDAIERARQATGTDSLPTLVVWSNGAAMRLEAGASWDSIWPADSGTLASALLAARRAAPMIATDGDSILLHVISPLRDDVTSPARDVARDGWPGRVSVITVQANVPALLAPVAAGDTAAVEATSILRDDAVIAAVERWGGDADAPVRVVRGPLSRDDSTFANAGGVLVHWPVDSASVTAAEPQGALAALPAVASHGIVLIGAGIAPVANADLQGRAIVWWTDGSPAATELPYGAGCIRSVAFTAPRGDALLDASARGVLMALLEPCGLADDMRHRAPLVNEDVRRLEGAGSLARAETLRAPSDASPFSRWLLLGALALLITETIVRARSALAS